MVSQLKECSDNVYFCTSQDTSWWSLTRKSDWTSPGVGNPSLFQSATPAFAGMPRTIVQLSYQDSSLLQDENFCFAWLHLIENKSLLDVFKPPVFNDPNKSHSQAPSFEHVNQTRVTNFLWKTAIDWCCLETIPNYAGLGLNTWQYEHSIIWIPEVLN